MKFSPNSRHLISLFFTVVLAVVFTSCGDGDTLFEPDYNQVPSPNDTTQAVETITDEDGLKIYIMEEGGGEFTVNERDEVAIRYTIWLESDNEVFDSSYESGSTQPLTASMSQRAYVTRVSSQPRQMTDGFYRGLLGMKEGEERTIVVPPNLGYGENENSSLSDETLIIDVELVEIVDG